MFFLKKLVTPFILPPGIFALLLIVLGGWLFLRKRRQGGGLCLLVGFLIWVGAISPVADTLMGGLECDIKMPENIRGDVILLLGGGVIEGVADFSGVGRPTDGMLARIVTAVRLQRRLNVPIIVSGGRVFAHGTGEAPVVGRFLIDLGVAPDRIILEQRSRDTRENAFYTRQICAQYGFARPILLTSAFHLKRAMLSYHQAGLAVEPFPAAYSAHRGKIYHWDDFLPRSDRLDQTSKALREYIGIWFYRLAY